jgi:peptide/nickel transport system permease protein
MPERARGSKMVRKFTRNRLSIVGLIIVLGVIVVAIFAPWLAPYPEDAGPKVDFSRVLLPPSADHLFGTDEVGRDIFSRTLFGTRLALLYAGVVLGIALGVGVPLGLIAGYWPRSVVSTLILRLVDVFLSVPPLALALAVTVAFEPSLMTAMIAISFTWWPWFARLVYGEALRVRALPFVEASQSLGQGAWRIQFQHILPNVISPIVVKATLDVSFVILLGASLSFLGVGAQEPVPDWGAMVARGRIYLPYEWWVSTMPGLAIFVTIVGFNFLGDALRDALDVWD